MNMQGLENAKNAIGEFRFPDFCKLREMHLLVELNEGHPVIILELCLETEKRQPAARLCVKFHQVSSLTIKELSGDARIQGFDIADISNRQLDDIRWQVFDFENGALGFYAKDSEITSASIIE
jgi:hypothetical protein